MSRSPRHLQLLIFSPQFFIEPAAERMLLVVLKVGEDSN